MLTDIDNLMVGREWKKKTRLFGGTRFEFVYRVKYCDGSVNILYLLSVRETS